MNVPRDDIAVHVRSRMVRENEWPLVPRRVDTLKPQIRRRITSAPIMIAANEHHFDVMS
jgi:hypothetical protein